MSVLGPFRVLMTKEFGRKLDLLRKQMSQGAAKDFAEYKYQCGKVAGLEESFHILEDTYEQWCKEMGYERT